MCDSKTLNEKFSIPGLIEFVDNEQAKDTVTVNPGESFTQVSRYTVESF